MLSSGDNNRPFRNKESSESRKFNFSDCKSSKNKKKNSKKINKKRKKNDADAPERQSLFKYNDFDEIE